MTEQMSMFDAAPQEGAAPYAPLAVRMRPETLEEYAGQKHLVGRGMPLRRMIETDAVSSMIFWGPPGVGKTTLARIIAHTTKADFVEFSAVTSGIREVREVMNKAEENRHSGRRTVLFTDEIHRFNKAQQDAFLPYVEKGSIILIGATTENPSFEINSALLSRCRVFILRQLEESDILELLTRALTSPKGLGDTRVTMPDGGLEAIARYCGGDARTALSMLEMVVLNGEVGRNGDVKVTRETLSECMDRRSLLYDKKGEEHYNLISALHKSMRNSDPDAAVYWTCRMLDGGEDPLYIARRMVRFASEDVGMADPRALTVSVACFDACRFIGMPECEVHLAHCAVYLSMAPKSNAVYAAANMAKEDIKKSPAEGVPLWIRNAPTQLMEQAGYGKGYVYAHDTPEKMARMRCLPDSLAGRRYYEPTGQGEEKAVAERLREIRAFKEGT